MSKSAPTPLSRSDAGKWLGGVCAGLGKGRGVSVAWIRAAFVVGALIGGLGILAYLACWLIIPEESEKPRLGRTSPCGTSRAAAPAATGCSRSRLHQQLHRDEHVHHAQGHRRHRNSPPAVIEP